MKKKEVILGLQVIQKISWRRVFIEDYEQVKDVVEVWFDSGSTHAFCLEQREDLKWPASMYLEGSDQHRGWFHSSLIRIYRNKRKSSL